MIDVSWGGGGVVYAVWLCRGCVVVVVWLCGGCVVVVVWWWAVSKVKGVVVVRERAGSVFSEVVGSVYHFNPIRNLLFFNSVFSLLIDFLMHSHVTQITVHPPPP